VSAVREAGRVALVDESGSVLLLSGRDPAVPGAALFWFLPGGGAKEGETVEAAAVRELYEEVGAVLAEADLGRPAWQRRARFCFDGRLFEQDERFWVVRTRHFAPRATRLTEMEARMGIGARWWALADLERSPDQVFPPQLPGLLAHWLAHGPPDSPLAIE
jgi:8-oxo-dGTP pyrophosphatase MutT (NUDIX family)